MNLNQIEYFVASCEERSITAAARRVCISQQTISSAVAALEAELGVSLLVRTPKGVYPTRAGEAVLPHAREVLSDVASMRRAATGIRANDACTVSFAFVPEVFLSRSITFIDDVMAAFGSYWPAVRLEPLACQADTCLDAVLGGTYDFGIVSREPSVPGLDSRLLFECTMDLLVPVEHPLARRDTVSFADLEGVTLPPPPNMSHPILDIVKKCQAYGFTPSFMHPTGADGLNDLSPSYFGTIMNGRHVGFVPHGHELAHQDGYVSIPFCKDDAIHLQARVVTKKGCSLAPAAQEFVDFVTLRLQETIESPEKQPRA